MEDLRQQVSAQAERIRDLEAVSGAQRRTIAALEASARAREAVNREQAKRIRRMNDGASSPWIRPATVAAPGTLAIDGLTDDALGEIFSRCDDFASLDASMKVCRRWKEVIQRNRLAKKFERQFEAGLKKILESHDFGGGFKWERRRFFISDDPVGRFNAVFRDMLEKKQYFSKAVTMTLENAIAISGKTHKLRWSWKHSRVINCIVESHNVQHRKRFLCAQSVRETKRQAVVVAQSFVRSQAWMNGEQMVEEIAKKINNKI